MTRIPEETIEAVRSKTDIVDVISEYIQLTKRGKNWFGLCPFHGESTPSFSVSEEKQLFHCFGCGASGNAITFVMDMENSMFTEAVVKLAERIGIEIEHSSGETRTSKTSGAFKQMYEAHSLAAAFYTHLLLNTVEGEAALHYLENRGFSREDIEKYGIGWSLNDWGALSELLDRKKFDMKEMESAGLCIMKDDGTGYYDRFRGRIMFPIHDEKGNVVAFSGRVLSKDKETAKYLNSPETAIFEKSQILYNFHNARLNVRKTGKVILFEGFMDTISADRAGLSNSVAVMGTALSEQHITSLKRIAKTIVVCCDGDNAGWAAAKRFADMAIDHNLQTEIAVLPSNMDPDDYISENGGEAFIEKVLGRPLSYMSFIMEFAKRDKNLSYENDLLQYIHEVLTELSKRASPIERDLYIKQLAEETGVTGETLSLQVMKLVGKQASEAKKEQVSPAVFKPAQRPPLSAADRAHQLLLYHMLHDGALFDRIRDEHPDLFLTDSYQAIFVRLAGFYEQYNGVPDLHRFVETLEDRELRKIVLESAMAKNETEHTEEEIEDCIRHLIRERIKISILDKLHESKTAQKMKDDARALELAREIIQLRNSL